MGGEGGVEMLQECTSSVSVDSRHNRLAPTQTNQELGGKGSDDVEILLKFVLPSSNTTMVVLFFFFTASNTSLGGGTGVLDKSTSRRIVPFEGLVMISWGRR